METKTTPLSQNWKLAYIILNKKDLSTCAQPLCLDGPRGSVRDGRSQSLKKAAERLPLIFCGERGIVESGCYVAP